MLLPLQMIQFLTYFLLFMIIKLVNCILIVKNEYGCTLHSSFIEREDWFYTINRTVTEHSRGTQATSSCSKEVGRLCTLICHIRKHLLVTHIGSVLIIINNHNIIPNAILIDTKEFREMQIFNHFQPGRLVKGYSFDLGFTHFSFTIEGFIYP